MLSIGVYIRVKFRAFFIDLGSIEKAWTIGVSAASPLSVLEIPVSQVPLDARKILDQRGVWVKAW